MIAQNAETGELDADKLAEEVSRAVEFRRKHTAKSREIIRRLMGNWYRTDMAADPVPENLIASYVTFMLAEMAFTDPTCRVQARRPVSHGQIATWMDQYLRAWITDAKMGIENEDVARDMLTGYGVMKVGMEPAAASYGERQQGLKPFACRIPPDHYVTDGRCERRDEGIFEGHDYFRSLDQIKSEASQQGGAGWDPAAVEELTTNAANDPSQSSQDPRERAAPIAYIPDRNMIVLVELWLKEWGLLVTLASHGQSTGNVILRKAPYVGPPDGPYEVYGMYRMPGDPYPISALQFAMEQFEELQAHVTASSDAAKTYKRFIMVDAANTDAKEAVMNAENGSVCPVKGLASGAIQPAEMGGPNSEQMNYIMQIRDRWDRVIGMGDAQRGRVAGKTATETSIVQNNVDGRTSWVKKQMEKGTQSTLWKVGWYAYYNPLVTADVSHVDPFTRQTTEGTFYGGPTDGQTAEWHQFDVSIVPESMGRTDDQVTQGRAMQMIQLAPQLYQMMTQLPGLNVAYLVDSWGESINQHELSKILFNPQIMAQYQQNPQAFGLNQQQPFPSNVNPSLASAMGQPWSGGVPPMPGPMQAPTGGGGPMAPFSQPFNRPSGFTNGARLGGGMQSTTPRPMPQPAMG